MKNSFKKKVLDTLVELIGCIELLIGLTTILFVILFDIFSIVQKPPGVFIFVLVSAALSVAIGFGILRYKRWARMLIIFFSGYVVFLKVLIYLGVVHFTGEILKVVPFYLKNISSVIYHVFVIIFFTNKSVVSKFKAAKKR